MKKIAIMSILGLSLFSFLSSHEAFAEPGGGGVVPCRDSDRSRPNRPGRGADRRVQGTTTGRLVHDGVVVNPRVTRQDECWGNSGIHEFYCANATDIAGTYVRCQRGETCNDGKCMSHIVLNQCGEPAGGWQNGATYVLNQNINLDREDFNFDEQGKCFNLDGKANITLDCRGHTIDLNIEGGTYGSQSIFYINSGRNITVKNCNFIQRGNALHMYPTGVHLVNSTNSLITGNTTDGSRTYSGVHENRGIAMVGGSNNDIQDNILIEANISLSMGNTPPADFATNRLSNNTGVNGGCNRNFLRCSDDPPMSLIQGGGNVFEDVWNCPNEWVGVLYQNCEH